MTTRTGVTCPNCGTEYVADLCDGDERLVSYWGEGDPVIVNCGRCDAEMKIREVVTRTWEYVPWRGDERIGVAEAEGIAAEFYGTPPTKGTSI